MSNFDFDRTIQVSGSPSETWPLMTDVPRLVAWISVVHGAEEKEPLRSYSAVIEDKVGMFSLRADLAITLSDVRENDHITVKAEGQDRQIGSRITIEAAIDLAPDGAGTTVRVHGRYGITGRAATLGSSQIQRKGEKVIDDFFTNLEAEVGALR